MKLRLFKARCWAAAFIAVGPSVSGAIELITEKEAAMPPSDIRMRGMVRAPGIRLVQPSQAEVSSPFGLKIEFEKRGGQEIDPKSVELLYVREKNIDLSARIKGSTNAAGIDVPDATAPAGEHEMILRVRDKAGRQAEMQFVISVKK